MLRAKRNAKMKKNQRESKQSSDQDRQSSSTCEADQARSSELDNISPVTFFSQRSHYLSVLCYACIYTHTLSGPYWSATEPVFSLADSFLAKCNGERYNKDKEKKM